MRTPIPTRPSCPMADLHTPNVGSDEVVLNPYEVAATRWLRLAMDSSRVLPKEVYLELGRDKSTFSRWQSYDDLHTIPLADLLQALPVLGETAAEALIELLRLAANKKPLR